MGSRTVTGMDTPCLTLFAAELLSGDSAGLNGALDIRSIAVNIYVAALSLGLAFGSGAAIAQTPIDLKGFQPGGSLEEAREHAREAGLPPRKWSFLKYGKLPF